MVVADQQQQLQNQQHNDEEAAATAERNAMLQSVVMPSVQHQNNNQSQHDTSSLYNIEDFNLEPLAQMAVSGGVNSGSGQTAAHFIMSADAALDGMGQPSTSRLLTRIRSPHRSPHGSDNDCSQQLHNLMPPMTLHQPPAPINLGDICANTIACTSPMTQVSSLLTVPHATYSISGNQQLPSHMLMTGQDGLGGQNTGSHKYPGTPPDTPPSGSSPSPPYLHNLTAVSMSSPTAASLLAHSTSTINLDVSEIINWKTYQVRFQLCFIIFGRFYEFLQKLGR